MTPTPPPSRYIPARPELLEGWCGPVEHWRLNDDGHPEWTPALWDGVFCRARAVDQQSTDTPMEDYDVVRLDPSRPEVRDMLARRLSLPDSHRIGEWATPLCWWAGVTGRAVADVLTEWERGHSTLNRSSYKNEGRYAGWGYVLRVDAFNAGCEWGWSARWGSGPETADAGKLAADSAALAHDCALLTGDGAVLLPPLVAGGSPILWSPA